MNHTFEVKFYLARRPRPNPISALRGLGGSRSARAVARFRRMLRRASEKQKKRPAQGQPQPKLTVVLLHNIYTQELRIRTSLNEMQEGSANKALQTLKHTGYAVI